MGLEAHRAQIVARGEANTEVIDGSPTGKPVGKRLAATRGQIVQEGIKGPGLPAAMPPEALDSAEHAPESQVAAVQPVVDPAAIRLTWNSRAVAQLDEPCLGVGDK